MVKDRENGIVRLVTRGWQREVERHQRTADRLTELLRQLGGHAEAKPADSTITIPEGRSQ